MQINIAGGKVSFICTYRIGEHKHGGIALLELYEADQICFFFLLNKLYVCSLHLLRFLACIFLGWKNEMHSQVEWLVRACLPK